MNEDITQNMNDERSFEERVFARFDALDNRFDTVETELEDIKLRLVTLEEKADRQAMETKPMWERALAEIMEVKNDISEVKSEVRSLKRKVDVLHGDVIEVRADQMDLEKRVDNIESKPS